MNVDTYDHITVALLNIAEDIRVGKRPVYTVGSDDVLANFKTVGRDLDLPPEKVAWVYFKKHLDAIRTYIVNPESRGLDPERIDLRIADAINYLILINAILYEKSEAEHVS